MAKITRVSKEYTYNGKNYKFIRKGLMLEGKRWVDCAIVKGGGIHYCFPIELFNTRFQRSY